MMTALNGMSLAKGSGVCCGDGTAKPTAGEQQKHQKQHPLPLDLKEQAMKEVEKRW
jgi:hypothetical protein